MLSLPFSMVLIIPMATIRVVSGGSGCIENETVKAAIDSRLGTTPNDGTSSDGAGWTLVYRVADASSGAVRLDFELRSGAELKLERHLDLAKTDCGAAPALMAVIIERFFRDLGWTAGSPLPRPAEPSASPAVPPANPPEQAPAHPFDSPPVDESASSRLPRLAFEVGSWVDSYPDTRFNLSGAARVRLVWRLHAELVAWLPVTKTQALTESGSAKLSSWTGQVWLPLGWRLRWLDTFIGPVVGATFESGSTEAITQPDHKRRTTLDLGVGVHLIGNVYEPYRVTVGLSLWGGRTLAGTDFFVDTPDQPILSTVPWKASSFKGAAGVSVGFVIAR